MTGFRCVCVALAACSIVAACASAPISVSSRFDAASETTPVHSAVATAARRFETASIEHGWTGEADAMQAAMRWVGRLTGQSGEGEDAREDAVSRYMRVNDTGFADPDFPARLQADLVRALELTGAVDEAARVLIAAQGGTSRPALTASLGDVETAMTRARDVLDLFDRLIAAMPQEAGDEVAGQIYIERDQFAARVETLRDRADELAGLRREFSRNPALS